jgi:hypothetical protein
VHDHPTPVAGDVLPVEMRVSALVDEVDLEEADKRLGLAWEPVSRCADGLDELVAEKHLGRTRGQIDAETAWRLMLFARQVRRDAEQLIEWAAAIEEDVENLADETNDDLGPRLRSTLERIELYERAGITRGKES